MDEDLAAEVFQALSNPDRLKVIRALVIAGPTGLTAGEIGAALDASPSRASFHLASLTDAGVLTRERQARTLRYSVDFTRLGALMRFLLEDCCKGDAKLRRCCGL